MAKNEDGEFELILGNRQLLSVFFLVVVLLGLCFLIGYVFGRNSAPVLNADATAPAAEEEARDPLVVAPAGPEANPARAKEIAASAPTPSPQTAPQRPPETAAPKAEQPKQPPAKAAAPAPASGSQPVPGRIYLQLSATGRVEAETMVDLLRSRNFAALAAEIPERPGTYRVLVGPLTDDAVARTRTDLKAANFPADEAIRRVF